MKDVVVQAWATDLRRYARSRGLWLMLLVVPIGARWLVTGSTIHIAVEGRLPVMTSPMIGVLLGVVAATMLLPIAFVYLRASVTRRQPWQVEEVAPAPAAALAFGRFLADGTLLLALLAAGTVAGWFLAWQSGVGPWRPMALAGALWVVAAPALLGFAALRRLLDALPPTRGALGDVLAFVLWITSLALPAVVADRASSLSTNLYDYAGYTRPIIGPGPLQGHEFSLGAGPLAPGRVHLDAERGLQAPGYVASRLLWLVFAVVLAGVAGLVYRPHRSRSRAGAAKAVVPLSAMPWVRPAPPATLSHRLVPTLVLDQLLLIGRGRVFVGLAVFAALLGMWGDYRHVGSPAAVLLLVFGLSAEAGRKSMVAHLASTLPTPAVHHGIAFVLGGMIWAVGMALPAAVVHGSAAPLLIGMATGSVVSAIAAAGGALTRSATAPRIVLLVLWYGYFAS